MNEGNKDKAESKLAKLLLVNYRTRRGSYLLRLLGGLYVAYLMYQMFTGANGEMSMAVMIIGIVMSIVAIYFMLSGGYAFINGIYSENVQEEPEQIQTESDTEN